MELNWHLQLIITIRLMTALALGAVLGYERSQQQKPAGPRTHAMVAVAAALFMVISLYGFTGVNRDPARLAAQVVTGMGFIGAGTIWKEGSWIRGLTTATTLWLASALGLAVGAGLYLPALVACGLALLDLEISRVRQAFSRNHRPAVNLVEELDLGSLKAGLERIMALPMRLRTFNSSGTDPYIISFEGLIRQHPDPFTITLSVKSDTLTLVLLYLPEGMRGKGYSLEILRLLLEWAKRQRFAEVNLTSKKEVFGLWPKLGFAQVSESTFVYRLN